MKDIADPDLQFYIGLMVRPETQERPNVDYVVDFEACDKTVRLYALNVSTFHKVNRNGLTKSITSCGCSRMSPNRWVLYSTGVFCPSGPTLSYIQYPNTF